MKKFALMLLLLSNFAHADCVYGAKTKTQFVVINSNTILLKGGSGQNILIKSFSFFYPSSNITVLQDSFCSFANSVLYVDGNLVDVQEVKFIAS